MVRPLAFMALVAALPSCATEEEKPKIETKSGDIRTNEVWKDGLKLDGVVRIYEGATVEIDPGARISCVEAVQIQVGGVLRVKSTAKHATITCPRWRGILVAQNGQLDVDG